MRFRDAAEVPYGALNSQSARSAASPSRDNIGRRGGDETLVVVDDGEVYGVRSHRNIAAQSIKTTAQLGRLNIKLISNHMAKTDHPSSGEDERRRREARNCFSEELDAWIFDTVDEENKYLAEHPKAGDLGSKTGEIMAHHHHLNLYASRKMKQETDKAKLMKAHRRFGHYDFKKSAAVIGMSAPQAGEVPFCRVCAAAKLHRADKSAIKQEPAVSTRAGEYLHIDGSGIIRFKTVNGNKYFVPVVDDHSGRLFVLLLAKKNHFLEGIRKLISSIEATTGMPVVRMKLDGDGAFRGLDLQRFCDEREKVITLQGPPPYTSHKNGKAEVLEE